MLGLLAVMTFLVVAAAYTSTLIVQRQAALQRVSRYNLTWLVSQASLEVARLHGTIGAVLIPGTGVDEDDLELRLAIVENRAQVFRGGEIAGFLTSSAEFTEIGKRFRETVAAMRVAFDETEGRDRLRSLLKRSDELQPLLARLAAAANTHGGDLVAHDQQQLSSLHWTFASILGTITLCGFCLVAALAWHNRQLAIARNEGELQNRALQVRDLELNVQNSRFDAALNNMSHALCMVDAQHNLIVCNVRFHEMFGINSEQARPGSSIRGVLEQIGASGRYSSGMLRTVFYRQLDGAGSNRPFSFIEQDGCGRALSISQEPMSGGGWVATFEDITERQSIEARVAYMAHHDALTDLPNRVLFHKRLQEALDRHALHAESVAILFLDLDQFKHVNDTLGHPAGDELLREVAKRLQACVRKSDLIVRLGGDEFAVLQTDMWQPDSAETLAQRVVEQLGRPYDIAGHRVCIGTSVGIAVAGTKLNAADMLVKSADIALYQAKADGRGRHRVFEDVMEREMQARHAMQTDLRQALERGELEVFYQPLYNLAQKRVCGFEALLRWRHPERGMVSPGIFIPVAEELGLIIPIGQWVLQRACADAAGWPDHIKVAVNLSPVQFQSTDLVEAVQRALVTSQLPASRLELEITESALLQDSQAVITMLGEIGKLGVGIALDDFGTGYSSLSYLRSFPFSKLKIDQSFIKEIAIRADCEAIVCSVTNLATTLGMTTTAEGVETEEQLARLHQVGCTEVQGFLFDRPRPVSEIRRWFTGKTAPAAVAVAVFSDHVITSNVHQLVRTTR